MKAVNFSRISQRKSQFVDEFAEVARTRSCKLRSLVSLTCKFQKRLSQSGLYSMISLSAVRPAVTGKA